VSNGNTIKTKAKQDRHDWSRFDAMTAEQRHAAALSDPDAQPLDEDDFKRMKRTPQGQGRPPRTRTYPGTIR
jgi:hypothetical protein